jgi:electron transfer flavoprotein alpha subunit
VSAQDIAILAEVQRGSLAPITYELLGGARKLAQSTGGRVIAFLLGDNVENLGGLLGAADRVLVVQDSQLASCSPEPHLAVLENLIRSEQPRAVLLGSTTVGLDLASLLAARLNSPIVTACRSVQAVEDRLSVVSQLYAGKMLADVELTGSPAILVVVSGSFREWKEGGAAQIEVRPSPVPLEAGPITFEEMILPEAGDVDITQQGILVSVGRGIRQAENIELAEELAQALGGVVSASRPVVDQGWLPQTRQVGTSGMTVKPKCYLALGISGAPEHVSGMQDSELIIAINSDPNAPIFDIADYGVVTDLLDLVPALTEALKNRTRG